MTVHYAKKQFCRAMAHYLQEPSRDYTPFSVSNSRLLRENLRPGDVLLIEGNQRISVVVKYLTQSTWSHAAMYVGDAVSSDSSGSEPNLLIEADLTAGVAAVPLTKYEHYNSRICRPIGLSDDDRLRVVRFMVDSIGFTYDLKNMTDLLRYLLPMPLLPVRWRRRYLALGSGDPARAICSTLLAQAFQSVRYPILPEIVSDSVDAGGQRRYTEREILQIRHHSLFTPRDFDLSPYFQTIKPTIERGFDYKSIRWKED